MISVAWAQTAGGAFGGFEILLPMVLVFVVFYFLLIRPQQKKVKAHQSKLSSIVKGDEILTGGGFYGKVVKVEGDDLHVRLAEDVEVQIVRSTVMDKLEKGTIKSSAKKKASAKEETTNGKTKKVTAKKKPKKASKTETENLIDREEKNED